MSYPKSHARSACRGGRHTECACYEILPFAQTSCSAIMNSFPEKAKWLPKNSQPS
jgi:hypothetical protein